MRALATALTLALPLQATAQPDMVNPPLQLLRAGIICPHDTLGSQPAPDTEAGEIGLLAPGVTIRLQQSRVPAKLGMGFGIQSQLAPGTAPRDLRIVVTHPPMGDKGLTRQSWRFTPSDSEPYLSVFTFEFPYEMVLGTWTMEVHDGEDILLRRSFDIVPEEEERLAVAICEGDEAIT